MLVGAGLLVLFVILDLAITWPNYAVLISLSGDYAAATDDAQRAALIATAGYPTAILDSGLLGAYIILVPGLGVLVIGLVMLRSAFGRTTAYLGVATGLAALVAVVGPLVSAALGDRRRPGGGAHAPVVPRSRSWPGAAQPNVKQYASTPASRNSISNRRSTMSPDWRISWYVRCSSTDPRPSGSTSVPVAPAAIWPSR